MINFKWFRYCSNISDFLGIGLTDLAIEGAFLWDSDLSAPTYTYWDINQPDNFDNDEDCVVITGKHTMKWNDIPCWYTDGTYAVCQKPSTWPLLEPSGK